MNPFSGSLFSPSGQTAWPCSPLHSFIEEPRNTPHLWGYSSCFSSPSALLPPCPLPCLQQGHEEGMVQAGLRASEPLRSGWGVPMTTKEKFCIQKDLRLRELLFFFPLGSYFGACRGILTALASPCTSHLLSFTLFSLPAPCRPSSSGISLRFIHLLFQEALAFRRPQGPPGLWGALKGY